MADVQLRAGQRVIALLGAANRDPKAFTSPDKLQRVPPLASEAGSWQRRSARLEVEVLFPMLLEHFPHLSPHG